MTTKLLEIRDELTFIPVLAVKLDGSDEPGRWLLSRAGYGKSQDDQASYILLCQIAGGLGRCSCDPYDWGNRTYTVAHDYILRKFDLLAEGDVVDVQFIVGETASPKVSERLDPALRAYEA